MGSFASKRHTNQLIKVTQIQETRMEVTGQRIDPQHKCPKHVMNSRVLQMSDTDSDVDEAFNYPNNDQWDNTGTSVGGERIPIG